MLASIKKGNTVDEKKFDHSTTTYYPDRTIVELSGAEQDGRKVILTYILPDDADVIYMMNDNGKTISTRKYPSQETPGTSGKAVDKPAEMRHAV